MFAANIAGDSATDSIHVINTITFQEIDVFPVGEDVSTLGSGGNSHFDMRITSDGRFLFLETLSGVRMYGI